MIRLFAIVFAALTATAGWGQLLRFDSLERLGAKASETVNVTLDADLLHLAARFLSDEGDEDTVEIKKLVSGLRGISIRSFEFKNAGEYNDGDIESIRSQLKDSSWKRIVETRSKTEGNSDVYLKTTSGGKISGLAIIAAEPKEFTVISIDGSINPEDLGKLSGNFGIPKSLRRKIEVKVK